MCPRCSECRTQLRYIIIGQCTRNSSMETPPRALSMGERSCRPIHVRKPPSRASPADQGRFDRTTRYKPS